MRIHNTMEMERIDISKALLAEAGNNRSIEIMGEPAPMAFDEKDNLF